MPTASYQAVIQIIGERAAIMLAERLGGAPIYIPQCPANGSPLVLAVGHAAAARLCDAFASQYLQLPSRSVIDMRQRRATVRYDLSRGLSTAETARRHGITVQHVRRIRTEETAK